MLRNYFISVLYSEAHHSKTPFFISARVEFYDGLVLVKSEGSLKADKYRPSVTMYVGLQKIIMTHKT